jgi:DNA-binding NarL/FixJ family response regulator
VSAPAVLAPPAALAFSSVGYASMADMPRLGSGIPLVARRRELSTLEAALDAARQGQAGAVLISGDAGVGKSRLLTELCSRAADRDTVVLTGGCLDAAEATLPYLPFVEALRQLTQTHPELVDAHPALRRLLPDTRQHGRAPDTERDLGQLQLFDALHSAITELAAEHTVLLAIEDLHWADRSSRDLLSFLLSRLSTQRLLIVGTFRSDDLHRRHPLRSLLAELLRLPAVQRLSLEPFGVADAEEFVRSLADDTVPDELVRDLAARSEGNAFMAEELISAWGSPGVPHTTTGLDVPHELAEILLSRVERLSPPAQQAIRLASVLGRRFNHARVAAASPSLGEEELEAALREAVAHHVLVSEDADTYAFRHALLREAVYGDLLPGERTRLHARVADALAGDTSQGAAAELAHHRMESHDLAGALRASWRAAVEADELGAPAEVLLHAERALKLWQAVPDPEEVSGTDELAVTRYAAWAASASGEPDRALAHSRSAVELADVYHDPELSADIRRRYASYLLDLAGTAQQAYDIAAEALELLGDRPPSAAKAWVLAVMARAATGLDRYDHAIELGDDAQRVARALPDDKAATSAEVDALVTVAGCVWRQREEARALELLDTAVQLAMVIGAVGVELRAVFRVAMIHLEAGRLPQAQDFIDNAVRHAAEYGLSWSAFGVELRVLQVMARFMAGDWDGTEAAAELAGEAVSGTVATRLSAAWLLVAVGRGRFDAAQRRLTQLRERWRTDTQVMRLLGLCGAELELWRGRPERATRWVEQALQWLRHYEPWHLGEIALCAVGVAAYADLAERARRSRDEAAVDEAVAAGTALAQRAAEAMVHGRPQAGECGPEGLAWMRRVEAEASRLRGEHSPEPWLQVVEAFGYGETYRQSYARLRAAEALLASGSRADRDAAAELLRSALANADELGAAPLRSAVTRLAKRGRILLGLSGADGAPGPVDAPADLLTEREHSVLTLVADGRTNRQIGAALFISEKTVSVHLSRVMAKLGAASRTEAVSAAYARGLLTTIPS